MEVGQKRRKKERKEKACLWMLSTQASKFCEIFQSHSKWPKIMMLNLVNAALFRLQLLGHVY